MNGLCFVCSCSVNIENFHTGHIISVKNGGTDNINNLRVVCSLCNLSMGTKNLDEFKNKYF
jgi:5-methylcytosine-specific restriction endonuclease McrA